MKYNEENCKCMIILYNKFRMLWEQHVMWTRSFIISTLDELKDLECVTLRLLRNPDDFRDALLPFYGKETACKFEALLKEHLMIGGELVNQLKNCEMSEAVQTRKEWYKNAEEIADFLSCVNHYWKKNEWLSMLSDHLEMTEEEALTRINCNYCANVAIYDEIEMQALMMADCMVSGIWKQCM